MHGLDLLWVGCDQALFGRTGDNLDMNMVLTGKEEALADREISEALSFLFGQLKDVSEYVNGARGLFEEELHRTVGDDSTPHLAAHEVFDVLGDGCESEEVLTGTFREAKEEVRGVVVLHQLPGLVNDQEALFLLGAGLIPDVRQDDIHCDRAELVLEVTDIKDDHGVVDVDIALLRENPGKGSGGVLSEALR